MILITGASGFVGSAVLRRMAAEGIVVRGAYRKEPRSSSGDGRSVEIGELGPATDWCAALRSVKVVVHTAARVHVMYDNASDPLDAFRTTNVAGTLALAKQSVAAGVQRFIFISSVKVNGEATLPGRPYTELDVPNPSDPYGVSKLEAEQALRSIAAQCGMEVVIIRPPLVYGPGVKANFAAMMRWLQRGVPLPLGAIHNLRSLVALDNLVDLIFACISHPTAANQTFLVSDGEDVSTPDLLRRMGQAMGKPTRLFPVAPSLLKLASAVVGKRDVVQRLCGSLQVDIAKTRDLLGWVPPISFDEGLRRAAFGVE